MHSTTKKKAPITRHPAFPVTVALWFAALFGMGSLLVHPSVLESLVLAIRLDRLIPAATPPLGFTARTLVAIVLAVTGGLIGFMVARALGGRPATPRRDARAEPVQRGRAADTAPVADALQREAAPADDNDDLARLEAARESNPARRRGVNTPLVVDPFIDPAPLTMAEPAILNLGDLTAIEPIGLPAAPEQAAEEPETPAEPVAISIMPQPELAPQPASEPGPSPEAPAAPLFRPRHGSAAEVLRQAPLDTLGVVELVERFALALADRRAREAAAAAREPEAAAPRMHAPLVNGAANDHQNGRARPFDLPAASPAPSSPVTLPGSVDWLNGSHPDPSPLALAEEADEGHLRSLEEGGWALPELDDEPEEAESAETDLPEFSAGPDDEASPDSGEPAFSSLLAMKPAARAAEAVARPAGATPEATEEALRKALATLQRMSGAA